jgi:ribosomal protein S18 acetylase RimI-like enzyme
MYPAIIELDQACFDGFWRFDAVGLSDAIEATPFRRLRAALREKTPIAYAITGRAGAQGYLQRIGVAPHARGQGWGQALVGDALYWLRRHGARQALVNTQLDNDHAMALYQRCGFRTTPIQLAVMERSL